MHCTDLVPLNRQITSDIDLTMRSRLCAATCCRSVVLINAARWLLTQVLFHVYILFNSNIYLMHVRICGVLYAYAYVHDQNVIKIC